MSTLPGNPHAESLEGYNDPRNSLEATATMALAHETRTLALIAYQGNVERSYHQTLTRARSGPAHALNRQIIERLGLEDERV